MFRSCLVFTIPRGFISYNYLGVFTIPWGFISYNYLVVCTIPWGFISYNYLGDNSLRRVLIHEVPIKLCRNSTV